VDSPDVIHKADEGGVVLGIRDNDGLMEAFGKMQRHFAGRNVSYLLQEQRPAGREIIVGSAACPGLGPLVMFGLGGVFVEVMKDVSFSLAPLTRAEASAMMKEIKGYRILEGMRGEAGVDLVAVEDLLCRVSGLVADFPQIVEMDLNPIFAYPSGTAPVAVDVRVKVS
jgi:acetyltransferase